MEQENLPTTEGRESKLAKIREDLNGSWSVNFERTLNDMEKIKLSPEEKNDLSALAIGYVQRAIEYGRLGNLIDIDKILSLLGVDELKFSNDTMGEVEKLMEKYPYAFLLEMNPTLYDGKLRGGKEYDKIAYTRGLLRDKGSAEDELTDEHIKKIWQFRELMILFFRKGKLSGKDESESMRLKDLPKLIEE